MIPRMTIIISHISALQLYRSELFDLATAEVRHSVRRPEIERAIAQAKPSRKEAMAFLASTRQAIETPVHLLTQDERARSRSSIIRCHVSPRAIPQRALARIGDGAYIVAPHYLFEQLAPSLSLIELVCLGFELCGDYRLASNTERSFRQRAALGTPGLFRQLLERGPWTRGGEKALRALRFVCAQSASPMETVAAIPLALPCAYGGYGLPKPQMNYRISLSRNAQATSGRSYLVADICWPEFGICAEYQSTQFHTGADRIDADARRQTALEECGFSVFEITAQQALSAHGMDGIAHAIAKKMGRRIRPKAAWEEKRRIMRKKLLAWHGFDA